MRYKYIKFDQHLTFTHLTFQRKVQMLARICFSGKIHVLNYLACLEICLLTKGVIHIINCYMYVRLFEKKLICNGAIYDII